MVFHTGDLAMNFSASALLVFIFLFLSHTVALGQPLLAPGNDAVQSMGKEFVSFLQKEDFASAVKQFDSKVRAALPEAKLQELWRTLGGQVGSFRKQVGVRSEKLQGYDVVYVTCHFERSDLDVKIVFNADRQIAGLFFVPPPETPRDAPQPPAARDTTHDREVVVGTGKWALHGTLRFPDGLGPFPAVVLVHGSGPLDRDETVGPNKPFLDLAEGLSVKGIAVLRFEKRTKEHASLLLPLKESITVKEETIDDALSAFALLQHTQRIDPKKVFLLGHSLGGTLMPRIAKLQPKIAGCIVMAGATRPLEDLILEQFTYIFSLDTAARAQNDKRLEVIRSQVSKVKEPGLSPSTPASDLPLGVPARYWLDLRGYRPSVQAAQLRQPMFIIQGERDYQVTMVDFREWQTALAGRADVTLRSYPALNHLFMTGSGKATPGEYDVPGHVAQSGIDDIAEWIRSH
jgi:fermentation-respiration switch protein FrsA (DUF1100 family)